MALPGRLNPRLKRRSTRQVYPTSSSGAATVGWPLVVLVTLFAITWMGVSLLFAQRILRIDSERDENTGQKLVLANTFEQPVLLEESVDTQTCFNYGCLVRPPEIDTVLVDASSSVVSKEEKQQRKRRAEPANERYYATSDSALVTRQSNQHKFNQDRAFLISDFQTKQAVDENEATSFLMAILDGHGDHGHLVAEHALKLLPRILADKLNSLPCCQPESWIRQKLNETFLQVNEQLPLQHVRRGGCTASVTLRLGSKLYFANVGDSRTVLIRVDQNSRRKDDGSTTAEKPASTFDILYQTRPDKAHLPEEMARIEAAGGKIHIPPKFPNGSRVIVYSRFADPPEPIGLAMSRCLGDMEWKLVGVIAEPIVDVVDLNDYLPTHEHEFFLLAASDGVWDMRPKREFFAQYLHTHITSGANAEPIQAVTELIWDVSPKLKEWYRDDMTIVYKAIHR